MEKRHRWDRRPGVRPLLTALVVAGVSASSALAQFGASNQFTLTEAQVDAVDSAVEGELAAIEALLADEHWDEGVERLRALAEKGDRRVVLVDGKAGLYISLEEYCQRLLCRLPPPALALYRARVDSLAEAWYREAVVNRDEELLERVVQQAFASSFGDDALYALGELALIRGDYSGARRAWERITPLAREPEGRPLWIALHGIDVGRQWNEIEPLLDTRAPGKGLVYPDTDLDVAQVLARLVLVSIREGALARAETEIAVLTGLHPDSRGRLGGKEVELAAALKELLIEARGWPAKPSSPNWPTFAGAADRNGRAPHVPTDVSHLLWRVRLPDDAEYLRGRATGIRRGNDRAAPAAGNLLRVHPILVEDKLLYSDHSHVFAVQWPTGDSAVAGRSDGVLYAPDRAPSRAAFQPGRGHLGVPRYTLTAAQDAVFARTGSPLTNRADNSRLAGDEGIVGLELDGGRLQFELEPQSDRWAFEGTPLVVGDRVLVALRQSDVRPRAVVACYSRTTGNLLWQTFVAAADTPARIGWEEISHNLLTFAGDTIYYSTNLGVIAAVGIRDGTIRWIKGYDRAQDGDVSQLAGHFQRDLTPCVYHHGVLYCAPADTPFLFALDAVTGQTLWASSLAEDVVHLLGVANNRLIASGERLWWFDATSGKVAARWPEGQGAGVHGYGRGVMAGDAVLWPTREQRIFVFDVAAAEQRREPIDLRPLDIAAGNLLVSGEYLVIAGAEEMVALGPAPADRQNREQEDDGGEVAVLR